MSEQQTFEELKIEIIHMLISKGYDDAHFENVVANEQEKKACFFYEAYKSDTDRLYALKVTIYADGSQPISIKEISSKPMEYPEGIE